MCNRQKITDPDELAEYRTRKRKEAIFFLKSVNLFSKYKGAEFPKYVYYNIKILKIFIF